MYPIISYRPPTYIHTYIHTYRVSSIYSANNKVRKHLTDLVRNGQHVTIIGSNWPSIELASHLRSVHTYIHTYIHTIHTHLHTSIHTYIRTYIRTYLPTYLPTYIHSDVAKAHGWQGSSVSLIFPESTPLAKRVCMYVCVCVCIYLSINMTMQGILTCLTQTRTYVCMYGMYVCMYVCSCLGIYRACCCADWSGGGWRSSPTPASSM